MGVKSARVPWNSQSGRGRGRPRKDPHGSTGSPGCVWPDADGTCQAPRAAGLTLCSRHAEILSHSSGHCTWPGCIQSSFHGPCFYHHKVARALIDAPQRI
jgi:hypothetical protein